MVQDRTAKTRPLSYWAPPLFVCFLFFLLAGQSLAAVNPAVLGQDRAVFVLNENPVILRGTTSSRDFFLELNPAWSIHGARLDLTFAVSEYASRSRSLLIIELNGIPLETVWTGSSRHHGTVHIPLPGELLQTTNTIRIVSVLREQTEMLCQDTYHPGLWMRLEPKASVSVDYSLSREAPFSGMRSAPLPLLDLFHPEPFRGGYIVIPDKPGEQTLVFFLQLLALWGQQGLAVDHIPLRRASQLTPGETAGDLLFIGLSDEFDVHWLEPLDSQNQRLAERTAGGHAAQINWPTHTWQYLVASDEAGLHELILNLRDADRMRQFRGQQADFQTVDAPAYQIAAAPFNARGQASFEQLGYGDLILRGTQAQGSIFVPVPTHWELLDEPVLIHLRLRHIHSLPQDRTFLTTAINGVPERTVLVGSRQSVHDVVLEIPKERIQSQSFSLDFSSNLYFGDSFCPTIYDDVAWVSVGRDSRLELPWKPASHYALKQFADRALRYDDSPITVIVDRHVSDLDLRLLSHFWLAAHFRPFDVTRVAVLFSDDLPEQTDPEVPETNTSLSSGHYLFAGSAASLQALDVLWAELDWDFDEQKLVRIFDDKRELLTDFAADAAILAYRQSPWNASFTGMVLSYNPLFRGTGEQLAKIRYREGQLSLDGDTAAVSGDGVTVGYFVAAPPPVLEAAVPPLPWLSRIEWPVITTTVVLFLLFILFLIVKLWYQRF